MAKQVSPTEQREADQLKFRAKLDVLSQVLARSADGSSKARAEDLAEIINAAFEKINP